MNGIGQNNTSLNKTFAPFINKKVPSPVVQEKLASPAAVQIDYSTIKEAQDKKKAEKEFSYVKLGIALMAIGTGSVMLVKKFRNVLKKNAYKMLKDIETRFAKLENEKAHLTKAQMFLRGFYRNVANFINSCIYVPTNATYHKDKLAEALYSKAPFGTKIARSITRFFERFPISGTKAKYSGTVKLMHKHKAALEDAIYEVAKDDKLKKIVVFDEATNTKKTYSDILVDSLKTRKRKLENVIDQYKDHMREFDKDPSENLGGKTRKQYLSDAIDKAVRDFREEYKFSAGIGKHIQDSTKIDILEAKYLKPIKQRLEAEAMPLKMELTTSLKDKTDLVTRHFEEAKKGLDESRKSFKISKDPKELQYADSIRQSLNKLQATLKKLTAKPDKKDMPKDSNKILSREKHRVAFVQDAKKLLESIDPNTEHSYIKNARESLKQAIDIMEKDKKGVLQDIRLDFKHKADIPERGIKKGSSVFGEEKRPEWYIKLRDTEKMLVKSADEAYQTEVEKLPSKWKDLKNGSAPTDMMTQITALILLGLGLTKSESNKEKLSIGLNSGIPALGGITAYMIATAKFLSGPQILMFMAGSGFILNRIGSFIDDKFVSKGKTYTHAAQSLADSPKKLNVYSS